MQGSHPAASSAGLGVEGGGVAAEGLRLCPRICQQKLELKQSREAAVAAAGLFGEVTSLAG